MSDRQKNSKFKAARKETLQARTQILRATADELIQLLKDAQEQIAALLTRQPSDYQRWYLPQLQAEIERALNQFAAGGGAALGSAAGTAWATGQALVDEPIAAGGIRIVAQLPAINTAQLQAMRTFMTDRMRAVAVETAAKINGQLGLVMIGGQSPGDAIGNIQTLLEGSPRQRAITVVRTEIGRAFATATQERMVQAAEVLPGLGKQWRRSGKIHSRRKHDLTDGQIRPVDQPYILGTGNVVDEETTAGIRIMYPHDPAAPPGETINCGCVSLPHMAHWEMATPGKRPFTAEEIRLNPLKQEIAEGKPLSDYLPK
jgi:uncharacterized protein with gpF-like domain